MRSFSGWRRAGPWTALIPEKVAEIGACGFTSGSTRRFPGASGGNMPRKTPEGRTAIIVKYLTGSRQHEGL